MSGVIHRTSPWSMSFTGGLHRPQWMVYAYAPDGVDLMSAHRRERHERRSERAHAGRPCLAIARTSTWRENPSKPEPFRCPHPSGVALSEHSRRATRRLPNDTSLAITRGGNTDETAIHRQRS